MINKTQLLDVNMFNPFLTPKSTDSAQTTSTSRLNFKVNKQNFKEYTKNTMKISVQKKTAPKKQLGFSSLSGSHHRQMLNSPCSFFDSSHEYKSPRSAQSSLQYGQYSAHTNSILPSFFLDEREASINCKEDIHGKIIEIGENIHESVIQDVKSNLESVYRQRELELMKKLEKEKEMNIENERAYFSTRLEEVQNQIKAEYELKLREKLTETQMHCQNAAQENLESHKIELRKQLEDKVSEIKEHYNNERKHLAERSARKERERIIHQIDEERKANEAKIEQLNEQWKLKIQESGEELKKKLRVEFDEELNLKVESLNRSKEKELHEQKKNFDLKIENLNEEMRKKNVEIKNLYSKLEELDRKNYEIVIEFEKIRGEFKNCIKRFTGLNPIESEFLFAFNEFNKF
ncbi:hypothetical protein BpHYR1_054224 [Brachionus plicatilis]|uniref:Uncharacterized protein n=1 Tax=Brachionus plicatilis TaxID=10195 RepID=A0A3M7PZK4_BRAPC|nr:hypothetical protein BpHYR1_054224 [Brachionus plicatilis]